MGIEVANYVNQLVATNPLANDPKAEGDDHLRLLKTALLQSFPNVGGAVSASHTQFNALITPRTAVITTGTAPSFVLTEPTFPPAAYVNGQVFFADFHAAGASGTNTLDIQGLGAKNLQQRASTGALVDAVITAGFQAVIMYDSVADSLVVLNPLPAAPLNFAFEGSAQGHQYLPSGILLNWGTATSSGAGSPNLSGTFDEAFPTGVFVVVLTVLNGTTYIATLIGQTQSGFSGVVRNLSAAITTGVVVAYLAIGN